MALTDREASSRKGKGGPKTAAGKAKSALNAVTHGLSARAPVALWFETEEAWTTFRAGIVSSLAPVGAGESDLAEKIALTLWRQNRVAAYETHRTNLALRATPSEVERSLRPDHTAADAKSRFLAKLTERLLLGDLELLKLQRYESHLGRELSRLFKHLHQLQDRRRIEHHASTPAEPSPATAPKAIVAPLPALTPPTPAQHPQPSIIPIPESTPSAIPFQIQQHPVLQNELTPSPQGSTSKPAGLWGGALRGVARRRLGQPANSPLIRYAIRSAGSRPGTVSPQPSFTLQQAGA